MTYATGHPVRAVGGRLILDFVNTADWTASGTIAHEKIESTDDLAVWLRALGLGEARPSTSLPELIRARFLFRQALTTGRISGDLGDLLTRSRAPCAVSGGDLHRQASRRPLLDLFAASFLSIGADARETARLKICPGRDCGWLFIDETRNARRKWCAMETCGNRAKATRHYDQHRKTRSAPA
ncbi:CGNR zinc finger domain-containing protein [Marivibrio halodurans]|uniref:CGNR zinc finger domain-containing protein n=1 Tax=Marivibrio halodurans TaxID=2039722 RepID=A0A8J7RZ44_9PROT|nr:CGNR zinc finger domain-containing protein [Marivibrio halodurans]MBP5857225.1 CGNR zinc finger domain-containing protein [Marivibrio halodurans]